MKLPGTIRRREFSVQQGLTLMGMSIFLFAAVYDALYYLQAFTMPWNMPITAPALVLFVMCQVAANFIGTMREVLSARQREREAREAEERLAFTNRELETVDRQRRNMMATLSHETRTPLAVISGYIGLMAMEMRAEGVTPARARDLDMVTDAIKSIAELMKSYEELSQSSNASSLRRPVSVTEVISRVSTLYRHVFEQAGMTLQLNIPGSLPMVQVQPGRLTQVLLNLMKNASKHSHGKNVAIFANAQCTMHNAQLGNASGKPENDFQSAAIENGEVKTMENGEWRVENEGTDNSNNSQFVTVTFTDDGDGIDPAILPNVFERGVTGKGGGAGIGLSVCKEIVEAEGGKIGIESEVGEGTKVWFSIPTIHNS
jgi:signal transduction histidine kinase